MATSIDWRSNGVRVATPADEDGLFHLLEMRHAEEGRGQFDGDFTRMVLCRILAQENGAIGAIISGPVGVEAAIGAIEAEPFDSRIKDLLVIWHFILPSCRRGGHRGTALIGFIKEIAASRRMAVRSDLPLASAPKGRVEAYEKSYGSIAGHTFCYSPPALMAG